MKMYAHSEQPEALRREQVGPSERRSDNGKRPEFTGFHRSGSTPGENPAGQQITTAPDADERYSRCDEQRLFHTDEPVDNGLRQRYRGRRQTGPDSLLCRIAKGAQVSREVRRMLPFDLKLDLLATLLREASLVLTARHLRLLILQPVTYARVAADLTQVSNTHIDPDTVRSWAAAEQLLGPARRLHLSDYFSVECLGPAQLEKVAYVGYVCCNPKARPWEQWLPKGRTQHLPDLDGRFLDMLAYCAFWNVYQRNPKASGTALLAEVHKTLIALPVSGPEAKATFVKPDDILDAVDKVRKRL